MKCPEKVELRVIELLQKKGGPMIVGDFCNDIGMNVESMLGFFDDLNVRNVVAYLAWNELTKYGFDSRSIAVKLVE